ncbi:PQQ-binding-like beta-propeller repeat protein [Variovorax paradoxus]|jgi:streptogramin lyase|uniref:PQQ-binding-like beta-propeller repeat protein n=1 Tax=Variovorax paradoxus TaxID=34073 RepID=UPI0029C93CD2|nr:PQQ-binding-like beta-propeller repeat protein [Variovorax paradoxus]WPH20924.1 PQQ-binding-like beta-propeller repeat protein [Variovorax paradoxus]
MPRRPLRAAVLIAILALLAACSSIVPPSPPPTRPAAWSEPEVLVAPSSFAGVHGLAVDQKGRLLAGSVLGNTLWEVDRGTGAAKVLIDAPEGQADDIAVGPRGELAWTNYLMGMLRYRESDGAPMRVLAKDLPGLNSLDFDRSSGKLYASQVFLGDALWEIDRTGQKPPRLIKKDMGGFNGFEVGPDGMLYGPLWFKGQVVKIDPVSGNMTVIADGFKIPAAANLDGKGNLWVVDARSGELVKVDLATGRKTVARQLRPSIDNLAIAPDGTIYVSNMANNEVQAFDPATGVLRTLTSGKLAAPAGLKIEGRTLWVADVFGFRQVDVRTGEVRDVFRMQRDPELDYPFAIGLSGTRFALTSWFTGTVQLVDRQTLRTVETIHGLKAPFDAIPMADGSVIYAEIATGSITRASGPRFAEKQVLASGLGGPVQMIVGRDGALYVTEAAGKLTRIPLDASAPLRAIADGLALPEGVAETPWGSFIVAESAARRLVEIDPANGSRRTVAENLPIGLAAGPGLPPPYVVTGVAVGSDGSIYMAADRNNAIYRIRPKN